MNTDELQATKPEDYCETEMDDWTTEREIYIEKRANVDFGAVNEGSLFRLQCKKETGQPIQGRATVKNVLRRPQSRELPGLNWQRVPVCGG